MNGQTQRAVFIFDGPNFYKNLLTAGLVKKHLDYYKLAQNLVGPRELKEVVFFTSPTDPDSDPENYANQQRFFEKLIASGVTLKRGKLVKRAKKCSECGATATIKIEKSVDVQIAIDIVVGCIDGNYDVLYLATCDSDLIPAIQFARNRGKEVFLLWPKGAPCYAVSSACRVTIPITQQTLDAAQSVS